MRERAAYLDWQLGIVHPGQPVAMNTKNSTHLSTTSDRDRAGRGCSSRLILTS